MKDYLTLDVLYDLMNAEFFNATLPKCIITLQRKQNSYGYFHAEKFENKQNKEQIKDEIALNPDHFEREDEKTFATLAHEMCHLWQHHYGEKNSKRAYHNKEWSQKMEEIDLISSSTGEIGGKRTGQKVSHFILKDGKFDIFIQKIIKNYKLEWKSKKNIQNSVKKRDSSKIKYSCPECSQIAYAKAKQKSFLICGLCKKKMKENI